MAGTTEADLDARMGAGEPEPQRGGSVVPLRDPRVVELPSNIEVEASLLGDILTNNKAYDRVAAFLREEHFYEPLHGRIYGLAARLIEEGKTASPITLRHILQNDEDLARAGGPQYLYDLATSVLTGVNTREYGDTIKQLASRRAIYAAAMEARDEALTDSERPAAAIMDAIEESLDRIRNDNPMGGGEHIGLAVNRMMDQAEKALRNELPAGIQTGFVDLDRVLGGLMQKNMCVLAARPGMGKTALAAKIATNVAESGQGHVLFVTMEMSAEELTQRIVGERAGVSAKLIRNGQMDREQHRAVANAAIEVQRLPLTVMDASRASMAAIRSEARRVRRRERSLALVVIDYLGLVAPPQGITKLYERVTENSIAMKSMAKALSVPILILHQLSRANESRDNRLPQLSDLRDSGQIEQDADQVIFIHRASYYLGREEPQNDRYKDENDYATAHLRWTQLCEQVACEADILIAKNRHGPEAKIKMYFNGELTQFGDDKRRGGLFGGGL